MKTSLLAISFAGVASLFAQSAPPPVIQIARESIKEGKNSAHRKVEQQYAETFRKNKYGFNYIALSSSSGPSEVWFVSMYPSFAAIEDSDRAGEKEPLKSAIAFIEAQDGELRSRSSSLNAVYRKDLSYEPENPLRMAKARYVVVDTFRVRLGKDEEFAQGSKMLTDAMRSSNSKIAGYMYQVVAGGPDGIFLLFAPMASLKDMDDEPARQRALAEAMGAANFSKLMRSSGEVFNSIETNIFSVSPEMSYAPKDFENTDPDFWRPKPAAVLKPKGQ